MSSLLLRMYKLNLLTYMSITMNVNEIDFVGNFFRIYDNVELGKFV